MIAYSLANTRDEGFEHENKDCAVRALKNATGVPYRDAHRMIRVETGRADKDGTPNFGIMMNRWVRDKVCVFGYRVFQRCPYATITRQLPTLSQVLPQLRKGRYMLCTRNHAFCVIDGVVHDSWRVGARNRILGVWHFVPSSQVSE